MLQTCIYLFMSKKLIRIATRKSPLALWQAKHVREQLLYHWPKLNIELLPMVTSGDKFIKNKLSTEGGKGLFVKELEEALLDERADLAVHSMKDVPALFPKGLGLAAICNRHNPLDALLSTNYASLADLPQGAIVGTASLRRQSQLLAIRPDLSIKELRGNIQTRIDKLMLGEYDAIVLAAAGLERMGLQEHIKEIFSTEMMLPACGQGALGIECRNDDVKLKQYITALNDPETALCVDSERRVNALLGGNCHVPLAVYCTVIPQGGLLLRAKVATPDGKLVITNRQKGSKEEAMILAEQCATALLVSGAKDLLNSGSV
jgi:hydroxymethylbilane synthase